MGYNPGVTLIFPPSSVLPLSAGVPYLGAHPTHVRSRSITSLDAQGSGRKQCIELSRRGQQEIHPVSGDFHGKDLEAVSFARNALAGFERKGFLV